MKAFLHKRIMSTENSTLQQISLGGPYAGGATSPEAYAEELQEFRENLLKSCAQWPHGIDLTANPFPILVSRNLTAHLARLSEILSRSITNIVERWWIDGDRNFPERMPVSPRQEAILRVSIYKSSLQTLALALTSPVDRWSREKICPSICKSKGFLEARLPS